MTAQIKKLQEQVFLPPSPTRLNKFESAGLIRPIDFASKQRGANGNIGHNRGPAIKPNTLKRMNSTQTEVSTSMRLSQATKDPSQFDYDVPVKESNDSPLVQNRPDRTNKPSSPAKHGSVLRDQKTFSFKMLTPPKLPEKESASQARINVGPASPKSKLSLFSNVSAPVSKHSSPYLGPAGSGPLPANPLRSPSRTSFRVRDSSGSLQMQLDRSLERPEVSSSELQPYAGSDSISNARSPKNKAFSIKKQFSSMFPSDRTKLYSSSPLSSNVNSQANLPVMQMPLEPKPAFKYDFCSMTGYSPDSEKVNQDYARVHAFSVGTADKKEMVKLFVLADGHGTYGALASKSAADTLISSVEKKINRSAQQEQSDIEEHMLSETSRLLQEGFAEAHLILKQDSDRRFRHSGTTLVCVLYRRNHLFFCNVGDSKAILCSRGSNPKDVVCSLETKLHKPDDPVEKERIHAAGGQVIESIDEMTGEVNGPPRVWNKAKTEPGLATSRSIGDIVAHNLGVSNIPGKRIFISRHHNKENRFTG